MNRNSKISTLLNELRKKRIEAVNTFHDLPKDSASRASRAAQAAHIRKIDMMGKAINSLLN